MGIDSHPWKRGTIIIEVVIAILAEVSLDSTFYTMLDYLFAVTELVSMSKVYQTGKSCTLIEQNRSRKTLLQRLVFCMVKGGKHEIRHIPV
jgi:hypothetical protein